LPYVVQTVADFQSLSDLFYKRVRWMTVMRLMRPWGHFGLIFTWGLPWSLFAVAMHPSVLTAAAYLGTYAVLRVAITWMMGTWGMKQKGLWKKFPLIPLWDVVALIIWLVSFGRKSIRWRGVNYFIKNGMLVAAEPAGASSGSR
jgi:ceramide glucosyltransferase